MSVQVSCSHLEYEEAVDIKETSICFITAHGDAWTNAPTNLNKVRLSGAETTDATEFNYIGGASSSSDYAKTGSRSWKLIYDTTISDPINSYTEWTALGDTNNFAYHFQLYIKTMPTNTSIRLLSTFGGGDSSVEIATLYLGSDGKLLIRDQKNSQQAAGTTVLSKDTFYQVEICWTINGTAYLRLNESAEANITTSNNQFNKVRVGGQAKTTDPNALIYVDDIAFWYGSDTTPWWNTTALDYRTEDAPGNYDQFTGVGDTTNKYNNVDDYAPYDVDTTYNYGDSRSAAKRQSHNLTDVNITDTVKGFMARAMIGKKQAYLSVFASYWHIRDNGVDYGENVYMNPGGGLDTTYSQSFIGYDHRPGGGALTSAALNAMDIGTYLAVPASTIMSGNVFLITADGTDSDFARVPSDGAKYLVWDEPVYTPNDADYIED